MDHETAGYKAHFIIVVQPVRMGHSRVLVPVLVTVILCTTFCFESTRASADHETHDHSSLRSASS